VFLFSFTFFGFFFLVVQIQTKSAYSPMRFIKEFLRNYYDKIMEMPPAVRRLLVVGFIFSFVTALISLAYTWFVPEYVVYEEYPSVTNHKLVWFIRALVLIPYFTYFLYRLLSDRAFKDFKMEVEREPSLPFFIHFIRAFSNSAEFQSLYLGSVALIFLYISLWSSFSTALLTEACFNFYLFSNVMFYYFSTKDPLVLEQTMHYGSRLVVSKKYMGLALAAATVVGGYVKLGLENKQINLESRKINLENAIESRKLDLEDEVGF
jgi:hypothetical protein